MFVPRSIPSSIPPASREASSRAGCYFKPGSSPERTVLSGPWSLLKGPQNGHRTAAASESTTGSGAGKMNHAELSVMETLDRLGCAATRSRWKNDVRPVLRRIKNGPVQGQPRPLQSIVCCKCSSGDRNMAHHCLCPNKTASKKEEKEIYASVLQQIKTMIDRDPQWGASRAMIRHGSAVQTLAQINQSRCTAPLFTHVSANTAARGRLGTDVTSSAHGNAAVQATAGTISHVCHGIQLIGWGSAASLFRTNGAQSCKCLCTNGARLSH